MYLVLAENALGSAAVGGALGGSKVLETIRCYC